MASTTSPCSKMLTFRSSAARPHWWDSRWENLAPATGNFGQTSLTGVSALSPRLSNAISNVAAAGTFVAE